MRCLPQGVEMRTLLSQLKTATTMPEKLEVATAIIRKYALDAVNVRLRKKMSLKMKDETLSSTVIDVAGKVDLHINILRKTLATHGYLLVQNTGAKSIDDLGDVVHNIGFTEDKAFTLGGRASKVTQEKWVQREQFRRLDKYPSQYYLLPCPEVQYMKIGPEYVSMACTKNPIEGTGGRTFIHSSKKIEELLSKTVVGQKLLDKVREHGLKIKTGYLNEGHPFKAKNYYQSVEERFGLSTKEAFSLIKSKGLPEEYDDAEIYYTKGGGTVLMTEVTVAGFRQFEGVSYLNMPRVALTSPSIENGYREYLLGNNERFSQEENMLLVNAYLDSREEVKWNQGDVVTFNNITHAQSKEKYEGSEEWPVVVAMHGVVFSEKLTPVEIKEITQRYGFTEEQLTPFSVSAPFVTASGSTVLFPAKDSTDPRYELPSNASLWAEQHPTRTFDAKGLLELVQPRRLDVAAQIKREYDKYGYVHVINSGISNEFDQPLLDALGFEKADNFEFGGALSGRTTRQTLGNSGFRKVDAYPPKLVLLPHNEILYQKIIPTDLLFTYVECSPTGSGGRTFVHLAEDVESFLNKSQIGKQLLDDIKERGLMIKSGFVDREHPDAKTCYTRSWQDRFGTDDIHKAVAFANTLPDYFDVAWLVEDGLADSGKPCYTLMTEITVPGFNPDPTTGKQCVMFPRVALNSPAFENGYRVYGLGKTLSDPGRELTGPEIELLLNAFLETRHGRHQRPGDILMVENFRGSHARESYDSSYPRVAGAKMSKAVRTLGIFASDGRGHVSAVAVDDSASKSILEISNVNQ